MPLFAIICMFFFVLGSDSTDNTTTEQTETATVEKEVTEQTETTAPENAANDNSTETEEEEDIYGVAFDIIGMTYGEIEDKFGHLSDPEYIDGAVFYLTPDGKRAGFNIQITDTPDSSEMCKSFYGELTDAFNVPENTNTAELLDALGVSYNTEDLVYKQDGGEYDNVYVWHIPYNSTEYKVIANYGENLEVQSIGLVLE